jgi:uncharacterized membrane protein
MKELLELAQISIGPVVRWLGFLIELSGALCIATGFVIAVTALIRAHVQRRTASFTPIRLTFSRYISFALEFQLASDILTTALEPTWQDLGRLGATAFIRTTLNFFLSKEIKEYSEQIEKGDRATS